MMSKVEVCFKMSSEVKLLSFIKFDQFINFDIFIKISCQFKRKSYKDYVTINRFLFRFLSFVFSDCLRHLI